MDARGSGGLSRLQNRSGFANRERIRGHITVLQIKTHDSYDSHDSVLPLQMSSAMGVAHPSDMVYRAQTLTLVVG
jgi:hypothetical protein